jgi:hypothetical protein
MLIVLMGLILAVMAFGTENVIVVSLVILAGIAALGVLAFAIGIILFFPIQTLLALGAMLYIALITVKGAN